MQNRSMPPCTIIPVIGYFNISEAWFKSLETGWDMVLDKIKEIAER